MDYRQLGTSGLTVSEVGLGCNSFGDTVRPDQVNTIVSAALDAGITLFDTADIYGSTAGESEELLGNALGKRRADVVLATKFGMDTHGLNGPDWGTLGSARYLIRAAEGSLRRLGTDYIDLYQMHQPDPRTPIEETLRALDSLVQSGKVRYLGSSNFAAWQVADADWTAATSNLSRFISAQNEYSLLKRGAESDLLPAAEHFGIGVLPYFPLASGVLTGKYHADTEPPRGSRLTGPRSARLAKVDWPRVEKLRSFAAARSVTMVDVAIGSLLARPVVASVIAGATSPAQIATNVAAGTWRPTEDDLAEIYP